VASTLSLQLVGAQPDHTATVAAAPLRLGEES
jgi:hypothetical protein